MKDIVGQYAVGACLRFNYECQLIAYSQNFYNGVHGKFEEIDVVGIDSSTNIVYICEVIIRLDGLRLGPDNKTTLANMRKRFEKMKYYGDNFFPNSNKQYMLWSPYVPKGTLMEGLFELSRKLGLNISFRINKFFSDEINKLFKKARASTSDYGEPFFRALQIICHRRKA